MVCVSPPWVTPGHAPKSGSTSGNVFMMAGSSSGGPGWFPSWNPFFSCAVDIHVEPDDEIGPRLRSLGIDPTKDLKSLVLSHLHHDHADGLGHFEGTDIVVADENFKAARPRITGSLLGAVPGQWPSWFAPRRVTLDGPPVQSFDRNYPLTADGTVFAVPTPGHMVGHMSVVVRTPEVTYFLAGDATYDEELLKQRIVDGFSENIEVSLNTLDASPHSPGPNRPFCCPRTIRSLNSAWRNASH
jgi:N-acyl homoserine lactone hydrolase